MAIPVHHPFLCPAAQATAAARLESSAMASALTALQAEAVATAQAHAQALDSTTQAHAKALAAALTQAAQHWPSPAPIKVRQSLPWLRAARLPSLALIKLRHLSLVFGAWLS